VVLCGHAPPGLQGGQSEWDSASSQKYEALVTKYSQEVMMQLFGHHSLDLLRASSPQFAFVVSSGLSPVVSTVPTFMALTHNSSVMLNSSTFFCDLGAAAASGGCNWTELPSLTGDFNMSDMSMSSLFTAVSKISNTPSLQGRYLDRQLLGPMVTLTRTPAMDKADICETKALNAQSRSACIVGPLPSDGVSAAPYTVFFVLGSLGIVALVVWIAVLLRQSARDAAEKEPYDGLLSYLGRGRSDFGLN